jgi:histidinol-phosphatase (PHP family)
MAAPVALEVNTGGIARGYTSEPYPSQDLLSQWLAAGKQVLFASDCHNAEQLLFGYDLYKKHLDASQ